MSYSWVLIAVLVIVLFIVIFKSQDLLFIFTLFKKYLFVIVVIIVILLSAFAINNVNKNYDTDYTSAKGLIKTTQVYLVWIKDSFVKIGRITGDAINQDWFSNSTSSKVKRDTLRR